jgi:hypothetical protein
VQTLVLISPMLWCGHVVWKGPGLRVEGLIPQPFSAHIQNLYHVNNIIFHIYVKYQGVARWQGGLCEDL